MMQPPLHAVLSNVDGVYHIQVAGTDFGTAEDYVAATNKLCSAAAEYQRTVFVEVKGKNGSKFLEISREGHVSKTTAPVTTTAAVSTSAGISPQPQQTSVTTATAPSSAYATASKRTSVSWKIKKATVPTISVLVLLVAAVASYQYSTTTFDKASSFRQTQQRWEDLPPVSPAQAEQAKSSIYFTDVPAYEQKLRQLAETQNLTVSGFTGKTVTRRVNTNYGQVVLQGTVVSFTTTGTDNKKLVTALQQQEPPLPLIEGAKREGNQVTWTLFLPAA